MIIQGNKLDLVQYCRRGLEFRTPDGTRLREQHKAAARDAVLKEQARQYKQTGSCDPEILAGVYRQFAYKSSLAAHLAGLSDMKVAQDLTETLPKPNNQEEYKKAPISFFTATLMRRHPKERPKLAVAA